MFRATTLDRQSSCIHCNSLLFILVCVWILTVIKYYQLLTIVVISYQVTLDPEWVTFSRQIQFLLCALLVVHLLSMTDYLRLPRIFSGRSGGHCPTKCSLRPIFLQYQQMYTNGLDHQCTHTQNQFPNKLERLRQIQDYYWKTLGKVNPDILGSCLSDPFWPLFWKKLSK